MFAPDGVRGSQHQRHIGRVTGTAGVMRLEVAAGTLAKALCTLLAHIAKAHTRHNRTDNLIASVATPLGCNQRRSIIPATQSERAPD